MKVKGQVHVYWEESVYFSSLKMRVNFKLPNHYFTRSEKKTITSSSWVISGDYKDHDEFWADTFNKVSDKEYLEDVAKSMIINYIKAKYKKTDKDKNRKLVNELIKTVNENFEIEVEHKEGK